MTLPQDARAPHRQARWIEAENIGSVEAPPFSVLEVVDSYRPEMATNLTPNDGRTVLRVRLATRDSPCATAVNGPCSIPAGENRRVVTIDDPMLAQVAMEFQPGTVVGVQAGSFQLQAGYCGYLVLGDYDAGTNTQRVKRWEDCPSELMVKADECIYPGDYDKRAIPMRWNVNQRCWEVDPNATTILICDCNKWLLAVPGECFKVERINACDTGAYSSGGASPCYRPAFPYGLTRRVRIKETISPDGCGNATILKPATGGDCYWEETNCQIRVCNASRRKVGCDADEDVTLHIHPGECGTGTPPNCYGWIDPGPRALFAKATGGAICGGNLGIDDIEYLDADWHPREQPKEAVNELNIHNCDGKPVYLVWNDQGCVWNVLQPSYQIIGKVLLEIGCSDGSCGIDQTRTKSNVVAQQCEMCGEQTRDQAIAGSMVELVSGIGPFGVDDNSDGEYDTCGIVALKKRVCVLCAGSDDGYADYVHFTKLEPATDIVFDCSSCPTLDWDKTSIWGLCVGTSPSAGTGGSCECSPCEASSASATPSATGA